MRKTTAPGFLGVLVAGLVLIAGLGGAARARAAEDQTPWLGVTMQDLTPELRDGLDWKGAGGVIVNRVVPGGPADRGGLRKGDVILSVNSRTVDSPAELQDVVGAGKVGQSVAVGVLRGDVSLTITVKLGARPADAAMEVPEAPETSEAPEASEVPETTEAPETTDLPDLPGLPRDREVIRRIERLELPGGGLADILGGPTRGRLGVRIESLTPELGDYFGLKGGKGVLVLQVLEDTPAERAGLKAGDVITGVGGRSVADATDLVDALRGKDGKVALRVRRHGAARTVEAALEKPEPLRAGREPIIWEEKAGPGQRKVIRLRVDGPRGPRGEDLGPGQRKVIRLRVDDRKDMRGELDQLRRQIEELQKRLDEQGGGGRDQ
jgi:membrane-associated protease RseP (regulator of RpoE activity)